MDWKMQFLNFILQRRNPVNFEQRGQGDSVTEKCDKVTTLRNNVAFSNKIWNFIEKIWKLFEGPKRDYRYLYFVSFRRSIRCDSPFNKDILSMSSCIYKWDVASGRLAGWLRMVSSVCRVCCQCGGPRGAPCYSGSCCLPHQANIRL
jgi:hypothetical protein